MKNLFVSILTIKLRILARLYLWRFKPTVIAVTGSVGKTSAKEAIYAVLKRTQRVRCSLGNFNTELGVPLTIIGSWKQLKRPLILFWVWVMLWGVFGLFRPKRWYPEVLVLEYGADKPGDISALLKIARPRIAVITAIGEIPVHVEFYPSGVEQVAKEKIKLIAGLNVSDNVVLNIDDKFLSASKEKTRAHTAGFGFSKDADVRIANFSHIVRKGKIKGVTFKLESEGSSVPVVLENVFSVGQAYAVACGVSVAQQVGMHMIEAVNIISQTYQPVTGRSGIIEGVKGTQIIDEHYNSSPLALELSLKTLAGVSYARRVGVLGDMMELGSFTAKAHERAGALVPEALDILITVGSRARFIASSAIKRGMKENRVFSFDTVQEAQKKVQEILQKGDLVFVKGSRVIGLEKIIEEIQKI